MEEPGDENRALPEKKQKRIVKTPSQVAALEKFYNEHKYPTEAMKLELAESIGLTEKQVSGWFCHRRLKDKKSPNDEVHAHGKQDRSSGVIQDRGSGLRQDSCGSTKQGDNKHSNEPKEVESRRFTTSQGLLPTQLRYDHNNSNINNNVNSIMGDEDDDDDDDTSSGSGSALKDQSVVDRLGMVTSKYPTHSNNNNDVKTVKGRSGPSGYLKVKGQVENAAITAVKRQLGRHYREDGPPLGIEFESLPPGAFDNPVKIPVNQSYYVGDRSAFHSVDGSKTIQHPNTSKMYERYNSKSYHPVDLDESGLVTRHTSKHREYSNKQRRNFQTEINQDSNRHLILYGKNIDANPLKLTYRDRIEPMPLDFTVKRGEFVEVVDPTRGLSRKTPKDDKFDGERRVVIDDYSKLGPAKVHPGNETRAVTKRGRDEFIQHGYPRKDSLLEVPPRTNTIKRSTAEMTSSFSDDETAETTSSGD